MRIFVVFTVLHFVNNLLDFRITTFSFLRWHMVSKCFLLLFFYYDIKEFLTKVKYNSSTLQIVQKIISKKSKFNYPFQSSRTEPSAHKSLMSTPFISIQNKLNYSTFMYGSNSWINYGWKRKIDPEEDISILFFNSRIKMAGKKESKRNECLLADVNTSFS